MSGALARARATSRRTVDAALAGVLLAGGALETTIGPKAEGPWWGNVLCAALMTLPLWWWRRRRPVVALAAFMAGATIASAWLTPVAGRVSWMLALVAIGYALGRYGALRDRWPAVGIAIAGAAAVAALVPGAFRGNVFFPLFVLAAAALPGFGLRQRIGQARRLAERTHALEAERAARERTAALDERRRIARELHDVIAHNVSVMVVQAGAARQILDRDPGGAAGALAAVEATGRGALVELRRLLGMLRPEGEAAARAPQPGLAGLAELIDHTRAAGLPVELIVEGTPAPLPAGIDLAAYRVVQEALTNTLKHAGPARARVLVRWTDAEVELQVTDTGRGTRGQRGPEVVGHMRAPLADGEGQGLVGMRERVAMCGGRLSAGDAASGGYVVRARLPREHAIRAAV